MRVILAVLAAVVGVSAYDALLFSSQQDSKVQSLDELVKSATPEAPLVFIVNPDFSLGQFSSKASAYAGDTTDVLAKTIKSSASRSSLFYPNQLHVPDAKVITEIGQFQPGAAVYVVAGEEWISMETLALSVLEKAGKNARSVLTSTDGVSTEKSRVKRVVSDAMDDEATGNSGSTGITRPGKLTYVPMPLILPPYNHTELGDIKVQNENITCLFYMEGVTIVVRQGDAKGAAQYVAIPVRSENTTWSAVDGDWDCLPDSKGNYTFTVRMQLTADAVGLYDKKPAVSIASGTSVEFTLRFAGYNTGYWGLESATLHKVEVTGTGNWKSASVDEQTADKRGVKYAAVESIQGWSWACSDTQAIFFNSTTDGTLIGLALYNTQIQTYSLLRNFTQTPYFTRNVDDCVGTFSPGSWMGIISSLVLLGGLIFGYMMLQSVQTGDRYDDPKHKQIVINVRE